MEFRKYEKVHRLHKEEVDGILIGTCYVQEKIDGSNTSVWLDNNGNLKMASRNKEIIEGFNGFVDYIKENDAIQSLLKDYPTWRLYMEWLVRHTLQYKETAYKKAYLFDIFDGEKYLSIEDVNQIADEYGIPKPYYFGKFENPTPEQLKEFAGQSDIGERGEGIVIKNRDFVDKFGDNHSAKIVTEEFTESNAITVGGNNKHSETYWEMYIVNKYITLGRVQKIMNKIQPEIDERLDMKHIPRINNTVYHDMITEEAWEIAKKVPAIDFKKLQRIAYRKIKQVYVDILNDSVSVADRKN